MDTRGVGFGMMGWGGHGHDNGFLRIYGLIHVDCILGSIGTFSPLLDLSRHGMGICTLRVGDLRRRWVHTGTIERASCQRTSWQRQRKKKENSEGLRRGHIRGLFRVYIEDWHGEAPRG